MAVSETTPYSTLTLLYPWRGALEVVPPCTEAFMLNMVFVVFVRKQYKQNILWISKKSRRMNITGKVACLAAVVNAVVMIAFNLHCISFVFCNYNCSLPPSQKYFIWLCFIPAPLLPWPFFSFYNHLPWSSTPCSKKSLLSPVRWLFPSNNSRPFDCLCGTRSI